MVKQLTNAQLLEHMYALFEGLDQKFSLRFDRFEKQVDKRFEQVDKRFEQVDKRFEQVDKRFDKIDQAFERLYFHRGNDLKRITKLETTLSAST